MNSSHLILVPLGEDHSQLAHDGDNLLGRVGRVELQRWVPCVGQSGIGLQQSEAEEQSSSRQE